MHFQEMKSEVEELSKNGFLQKVCFLDEAKEGSSKEACDTDNMKPPKGSYFTLNIVVLYLLFVKIEESRFRCG